MLREKIMGATLAFAALTVAGPMADAQYAYPPGAYPPPPPGYYAPPPPPPGPGYYAPPPPGPGYYAPPPPAPTQVITNGPQFTPGDNSRGAARSNMATSEQYERQLSSNPGFRRQRMQKECGPINDPELRQSCMASFGGSR